MKYAAAMKKAKADGAGRCEGLPLLAMTITTLRDGGHRAIQPEAWYDAARNLRLSAADVMRMLRDEAGRARFGFLPWEDGAATNTFQP